MNMALDELLWQSATAPQLRLYEWDHPALSFGYFGAYADVAPYESERDLVRRCTGGGIVFHGCDLTYALVVPAGDPMNRISSAAIYSSVHEAVKSALRDDGLDAALSPAADCSRIALRDAPLGRKADTDRVIQGATSADLCFAQPVPHDVLVAGIKVAGAAQRRSRRGLLQQGSIQNVQLSANFRNRFITGLSDSSVNRAVDEALLHRGEELAGAKYGSSSWSRRR
jgi:lipoate-protein ligase A